LQKNTIQFGTTFAKKRFYKVWHSNFCAKTLGIAFDVATSVPTKNTTQFATAIFMPKHLAQLLQKK